MSSVILYLCIYLMVDVLLAEGKETVEGKSQEVPVRVAKHVGFSATILADFKAKQEKRASQLSLTSVSSCFSECELSVP